MLRRRPLPSCRRNDPAMNVLLVTADQWRGDCLSCLGHPAVRTPNLDRLAADGVLFTRHFAQATPCGPSRASLHTGLYALNHRSITNGTPLDARHKTLASLARAGGYDPVLFGYTDTSADPRTLPPDSPWLRTYEGVAPGFRVELRLPEAEEAYLDHLAERGYGRLDLRGGLWRRLRAAGAVPRRGQRHGVPGRPVPRLAGPAGRRGPGSPTSRSSSRTRRSWRRSPGTRRSRRATCRRRSAPPRRRPRARCTRGSRRTWRSRSTGQDRRALLDGDEPRAAAGGLFRADRRGRPPSRPHPGAAGAARRARPHAGRWSPPTTARCWATTGCSARPGFFPQAFHVPLLIRHPDGARGRRVDGVHRACRPDADGARQRWGCACRGSATAALCRISLQANRRAHGATPRIGSTTSATSSTGTYERALGLASDDCGLAVRFDGRCGYVHFAGLPPLCFVDDPAWLHDRAGDPAARRRGAGRRRRRCCPGGCARPSGG